ncbi:MAG: hypothetical protein A2W05_05140 [Candidatus Schekmanbacteria bacterium RBG_16_38_10]|uniref:Uncharacterized protein n=1 Tax=Candidatus Schekmanbacteria bacterium RBG_16_38_10 TaxID=1817879 RepID=A0A1F7RU83_9BACT|nr:MAG: hypothetical protein A2W05_05140 [Candidatus Schekmanbacteria bacterium RBG_16_38_10]
MAHFIASQLSQIIIRKHLILRDKILPYLWKAEKCLTKEIEGILFRVKKRGNGLHPRTELRRKGGA